MNTVELGPIDNPNVTLEENNDGEPVLRHEPSGATFEYDSTAGEWVAADLKLDSLSTEQLSNAPIVFSSEFSSYQAAIDAAGGGMVALDDSKQEMNVMIGGQHSGLTVFDPGEHPMQMPSDSPGDHMFQTVEGQSAPSEITGVSFHNVKITNPNLSEGDILDNDTIGFGSGRESPRGAWGLNRTGDNSPWLRRWEWVNCEAWNLNGQGIRIRGKHDNCRVTGFDTTRGRLALDGLTFADELGDETEDVGGMVVVSDSQVGWCGRHNYTVAGDGYQDARFENIVGYDSFRGGLDIEPGGDVHVTGTFYGSGRNADGNIDAALVYGDNRSTGGVTGEITAISPAYRAFNSAVGTHDVTVNYVEDVGTEAATEPIQIVGGGGNVEVNTVGGGSRNGVVQVQNAGHVRLSGAIQECYGTGVLASIGGPYDVDVSVIDPVQGGDVSETYNQTYVSLNGQSGDPLHDVTIDLNGQDSDGNVNNGVGSRPGDYSNIRVEGNFYWTNSPYHIQSSGEPVVADITGTSRDTTGYS